MDAGTTLKSLVNTLPHRSATGDIALTPACTFASAPPQHTVLHAPYATYDTSKEYETSSNGHAQQQSLTVSWPGSALLATRVHCIAGMRQTFHARKSSSLAAARHLSAPTALTSTHTDPIVAKKMPPPELYSSTTLTHTYMHASAVLLCTLPRSNRSHCNYRSTRRFEFSNGPSPTLFRHTHYATLQQFNCTWRMQPRHLPFRSHSPHAQPHTPFCCANRLIRRCCPRHVWTSAGSKVGQLHQRCCDLPQWHTPRRFTVASS